MYYNPASFVARLQKILAEPMGLEEAGVYLDISTTSQIDRDVLQTSAQGLPPSQPLIQVLAIILLTMARGPFDLTRLGINELLKSYLQQVNIENQEFYTQAYIDCIYQIYLFNLAGDYPFKDLLWEYLSKCFITVGRFLVEQGLVEGCQIFLNRVSTMGKSAAQKGLHTSSIQSFLHNLEVRAREEGFDELADSAKNHRFNLETF